MKLFRNITMLLMAAIFLISSSGYVLYTSKCVCTGEEKTSVFVRPETCETSFHTHHNHDILGSEQECSSGECHDCYAHEDDCGCGSPEMFFFKLEEKAINEEAKFLVAETPLIQVNMFEIPEVLLSEDSETTENLSYCDPPPKISSGFDFLISIQQLKIPSLA